MKNIIPVIVVILILLGAGGYLFMNSKKAVTPTGNTVNTKVETTGGNIFTSIKDALSKSISLKCDYPDPTGKGTITSYIKNGAVFVASMNMGTQGNGSAIIKDNKMWLWNTTTKQGMLFDLNTGNNGTPAVNQSDKVLQEMEKYKSYCKTDVVSDSLFTPPVDVKFQDLNALMKGVDQDYLKNIPKVTVEPTVVETQPVE